MATESKPIEQWKRALTSLKLIHSDIQSDRIKRGELVLRLRALYDGSADIRRLGPFWQLLTRATGYNERTAREWVADYKANQEGRKDTSAAKRRVRRHRAAKALHVCPNCGWNLHKELAQ
jgi:hypothetical protein